MSGRAAPARRPRPRYPRGRALLWALVAIVAVLAAGAIVWGGLAYVHFTRTPIAVRSTSETLEVARGAGFREIVGQLRAGHFSDASPLWWRALAWRMGVASRLHAGEYALAPGMTPGVLLENMANGRVLHRRVTLVDGWTFAQVRQALGQAPRLTHRIRRMSDAAVMSSLGAHDPSPEGEFMPDTYDYVLGMTDLEVLARAHEAMQAYLARAWAARDPSVPLATPYEALILASLVEKETAVPAERAEIAGVFERRLRLGMKLDTDPSVIFGMGTAYAGKIHKVDLQTDTPYNTYMRYGLPPTPIALPGRAAIHAVLHPAEGDALYFVARGDGTHQFSATLAEQNAAVRRYILGKKPR